MGRNTLILAGLVVLLWGAWYLFSREERSDLSVRERTDFFSADSSSVDSISVRYGNWVHLVRRDGQWIVKISDWETIADPNILQNVFKFTNEMVLENLISTRAEKHASFKVDTLTGTMLRFFSGGEPTAEFVMGKAGADFNHTYIRQLRSDSVYLARGDFQRVFRRVPMDWGSRVIFQADSSQLASIRWITRDEEVRVVRNENGAWLVYKNSGTVGLPVDTSVFNVRLRTLSPLTIDTYASEGWGDTAQVDAPYMQLILDTRDGRADTLLWNAPSDKSDRMYAFRPGRPKPLFIFHQSTYDRITFDYRELVFKGGSDRVNEPGTP